MHAYMGTLASQANEDNQMSASALTETSNGVERPHLGARHRQVLGPGARYPMLQIDWVIAASRNAWTATLQGKRYFIKGRSVRGIPGKLEQTKNKQSSVAGTRDLEIFLKAKHLLSEASTMLYPDNLESHRLADYTHDSLVKADPSRRMQPGSMEVMCYFACDGSARSS